MEDKMDRKWILKEYHTSLDNEKTISFTTIIETINIYLQVLNTIENNFVPVGKVLFGTPQLSKSTIKLYGEIMNFRINEKGKGQEFYLKFLI